MRNAIFGMCLISLFALGCDNSPATSYDATLGDASVADAALPDAAPPDPYPWGDLTVSGQAYFFDLGAGLSIEHLTEAPPARVWVLEYPELDVTLAPDGRFSFPGFAADMEVTLRLDATGFQRTQTGTLTVGPQGVAEITFQVMSFDIADAVMALMGVDLDDSACHIATTVTAANTQAQGVWAPGEPGATVVLTPAVDPHSGPYYFDENVMPTFAYSETSADGGILYFNVPEGDYVMQATKAGVVFAPAVFKCRAGWLVNASPPYGVQAL